MAHSTIFGEIELMKPFSSHKLKKHIYILCISLIVIQTGNDQLFVLTRFSDLYLADVSQHPETGKVFFALVKCGNRQ